MNAPYPHPSIQGSWRAGNLRCLRLRLQRLLLRMNRRMAWLRRGPNKVPNADWLIVGDAGEEQRFFVADADANAMSASIARLDHEIAELDQAMRGGGRASAFVHLVTLMQLTPFEADLLLLAAAPSLDGAFARACAELQGEAMRARPSLQLALTLFIDDAVERFTATDVLLPQARLRAQALVELEPHANEPVLTRGLHVDARLVDFLRGVNRIDERVDAMLLPAPVGCRSGSVEKATRQIVALMDANTDRWLAVNLVGPDDAGALEAASAACESAGLEARILALDSFAMLSAPERAAMIALFGREAALCGLALLVDVSAVAPASPEERALAELVATISAHLFVVGGSPFKSCAVLPRVYVERPGRAEQALIWSATLGPRYNALEDTVRQIVQQYDFGSAAITAATTTALATSDGVPTAEALWNACRVGAGRGLEELALRIEPAFVWDDIVLTSGVRQKLREVANQAAQRDRVYETWGFGRQLARGRGITALFAGSSGTGKTMAAEVLASQLQLDLYRVDLASMVSKYIGETEKNLRRVFEAAQRSGAILFFDEADALFGSRTETRDSHDRYANLEINYLLQRMEDYSGLAILATNRRTALDSAFIRRLRFVIEFPFPGPVERLHIWRKVIPAEAQCEALDFDFLAGLELSGGNIRSAALNAAFSAAGESRSIGMPHLVQAAAGEYVKLSKSINAAEFRRYHGMVRV